MKWNLLSDGFPKEDEIVLVTDGKSLSLVSWTGEHWHGEGYVDWGESESSVDTDRISHWMPAPELPK